jgi:anti-sigma-K factor RskA
MTEERANWGCEECSADLAELALGVLTGRDRARALAHVETCPHCAEQLEQLSRAADTVLLAAPVEEPPMGFEVRLFDRMGVRAVTPGRRRGVGRPRWLTAAVTSAAAAVAALGVGLGVTLSSSPSPTAPVAQATAPHMESANLVAQGRTVGHVVYFNGRKPWMSMMLADSGVHGTVNCVVVGKDGVTHKVGTLVVDEDGDGAWYSPLHLNPDHLRAAKVVSPSGAVIATAALG